MARCASRALCRAFPRRAGALTHKAAGERWADQAAFDGHMAGLADAPKSTGPAPKGFDVKIYDIEGVREFG